MTTLHVIEGLAVVHVLWVAAFLLGSLLFEELGGRTDKAPLSGAIDFVLATALGLSLITFAAFLLAAAGCLNAPASILAWLLMTGGLALTLRTRGSSWQSLWNTIRAPLSVFRNPPAMAIYVIAILASVPATLPPTAWDSTMYHLPNAINWALSGHLVADPFLRSPYNAYNFELLYALAFVFHLNRFVLFVDWLPFVCSGLGIWALTSWIVSRYVLSDKAGLRYSNLIGFASALAFLFSPLVLSYALNGYVDVAAGFYLLAAGTALVRSVDRFVPYAFIAAMIGGTFLGTKIQLVLFLPLFLLGVFYSGRVTKAPIRATMTALIVLFVFAAPWYTRNFVATGDPLSPVLNVLTGRHDPIYDRADYEGIRWNLHYGAQTILDAPANFLLDRTPPRFLEDPGTSTSIALVAPMPIIALLLLAFRSRWRVPPEIVILVTIVGYSIAAIMAVSLTIGRYSLSYFALFQCALGIVMVMVIRFVFTKWKESERATVIAGIIVILVLALPQPISAVAYASYVTDYSEVRLATKYPDKYLRAAAEGDLEATDLSRLVRSSGVAGNTLDLRYENAAYYFRLNGVTSVGDWFGPGRYADLYAAIHQGAVPSYFQRFHIDAVLIGNRNPGWSPGDLVDLLKAISKMGYVEVTLSGDTTREFLRADVAKAVDPTLLASPSRGTAIVAPAGLGFVAEFRRGTINSNRKALTPTGRGVLLYSWLRDGVATPSITVVSQFDYRFDRIRASVHSRLHFEVGKPFPDGKAAVAWVDVTVNGKRRRIASIMCAPSPTNNISWHNVDVAIPSGPGTESITFGASSLPGGGVADWVAFADPTLSSATFITR